MDATSPNDEPLRPRTGSLEPTLSNLWLPIPVLPRQLSNAAAVVYSGKCVRSIGGTSGSAAVSSVNTICSSSPPPSIWTAAPPLPAPLHSFAGAGVINGKTYVAGGMNALGQMQSSLYVFSNTTGRRLSDDALPFAMACGSGAEYQGRLYVAAV